jgi:hypothetical protein
MAAIHFLVQYVQIFLLLLDKLDRHPLKTKNPCSWLSPFAR